MSLQSDTYGSRSFPIGLKNDLDNVFSVEMKEPYQFEPAFRMKTTDDAFYEEAQVQMPGKVDFVNEGGSFVRVDIEKVRTKRYVIQTVKVETKITMEAMDFYRYELMKDGVRALSTVMHRTFDDLAASVFYNGFTTTQSADNVSFFNTGHTLTSAYPGNPTTFGNRSTGKLTPQNLKNRRVQMLKSLDEHGDPVSYMPDQIIYGPDLDFVVKNVLQDGYEPNSGNLTKNFAGQGLQPIRLDYIQKGLFPYMWVLRDSKMAQNTWIWGKKPTQWVDKDTQTGDWLYRAMARCAFGVTDYRGNDGNTGEI